MHTTKSFKGDVKQDLFGEHLNCFQNDPHLNEILELLNPQWRTFVDTLLREKIGYKCRSNLATSNRKRVEYFRPNYILYKIKREETFRTIIYHTFEDVDMQVLLSREQLIDDDFVFDEDYADETVERLHLEITSPIPELYERIRPRLRYLIFRRSEKINCALLIQKSYGFLKFNSSRIKYRSITNDQPLTLPDHNISNYRSCPENPDEILINDTFLKIWPTYLDKFNTRY